MRSRHGSCAGAINYSLSKNVCYRKNMWVRLFSYKIVSEGEERKDDDDQYES